MTLHREPEPTFEEAEEALSEGDAIFRTRRPGTVLAALSHQAFRRMWIGSFASNIGTWMQTLVLGAYAYDLTGSSAAPAYPVVLVLGAVYFGTVTAMMTLLQETLADAVRGRVMALWFMAFGGTVPLGALAFGPVLDATSNTVILTIGAAVALALAWWSDLPAAKRRLVQVQAGV